MNTIDLQQDATYPGTAEMRGLVRSLGPSTLFDLFESNSVPEGDRFGLIEEALALLIAEGRREDDLSERFLEVLDARCRAYAGTRAGGDGNEADPGGFELVGRVEHLCQASQEEVFHDPSRAVDLARRAVELADLIDPQACGDATAMEQRILAWARLGNARRVASDLYGSDQAFQESLRLIEQTGVATLVRAEVWNLLGSLRLDQGRYLEARLVLKDALAVYERLRAEPEQTKVRIKLADAEAYDGRPERAVEILREAMTHLDEEVDGRLQLQLHHNLTLWMVDAGQPLEALARFEKERALYDERWLAPRLRIRRRWLEGRIYAALGDLDLASAAFEEVRTTAIERELSYELAMVSLELALVHLRQGQTYRVKELAEEMTVFFRSHDLHRHALGAMYLFRQAARTDTATVGLVEEMLRYFQRARNNPYLRFEPGKPPQAP